MSQSYVYEVRIKGSKSWGYADLNGEVIIDPAYKLAFAFGESGQALVIPKKRWAIINLKGDVLDTGLDKLKVITDPWTGVPEGYSDGLLCIRQGSKWGALNTEGKITVPAKYDNLATFSGGYSIANIGDKYMVVDKEGNEFPIDEPGIKGVKHFSEGLAPVKGKDSNWGFVDTSGELVISPKYSTAGYFSGGLAWVRDQNGKLGYIDNEGNWVIDPRFSAAKNFDPVSGMALVTLNDQLHYISKDGTLHSFEQTSKLYHFSNGFAIARWEGKIGFINNKMEWVVQPIYEVARAFHNGYATVRLDDRWGVIDEAGNVVVEPKFMDIRDVKVVR
jgi:hypothetical protein